MEAAYISALVDRTYLDWGLAAAEGIEMATEGFDVSRAVELLPEELANEIVSAIKSQLGLSEQETKN